MQDIAHLSTVPSTPMRLTPLVALVAAKALALAACGDCDGGGGGSTASTNTGEATTAATDSGAVSCLGSIVGNGMRFSTGSAGTTDAESSDSCKRAFVLGTTASVLGSVDDSSATATASSNFMHGGVRGAVLVVS